MLQDWAFAQKGEGVTVQTARGDVKVMEFNEFLGRIASGQIGPEDVVVSQVMTDGVRRRVGDLKLYGQVISGRFQTADLPRRVPGGVLAIGIENAPSLQQICPTQAGMTTQPSVGILNAGTIVRWLFALLGFSLLCAQRPGTPGTHPASPVHFRPATHPEHPPWLPR
jgi:hypothetical protein